MTLTKRILLCVSVCMVTPLFAAEQSTPYVLTDFPISLIVADTAIWIKWSGASRTPLDPNQVPDSGRIYFGKSPGGSIIENYTDSVTKRVIDTVINEEDTSFISQNNILFTGTPPQRGIMFRPSENGMSAGIYYLMVAWKTKIGLIDTTFYSNEIQLIIESSKAVTLTSPGLGDTVDELTPTFEWEVNPGVPYYHVIVSDEKINVEEQGDSFTVEGLSIIWEAITSNNQITYGAPDPSGTITADPPPLSPGKEYGWVVLNNYGNHPAYSSTRFSLPTSFRIEGIPLKTPLNVWDYPTDTLNSTDNDSITLKWTNLDSLANTYKIYIYVGSDFEGVDAQMVLWSKEVTAGQYTGDTASVSLNAKAILTDNYYTWKVIAVDDKGGGTAGKVTGFRYDAPTGTVVVTTKEQIVAGGSTITKNVGLVEVKVEVLDGSLEAPLLFYTDNDGYLSRTRPVGTYRLTVIKDGFESQTKTVTLDDGETEKVAFIMKRPDATVYGKIVDEAGKAINLAVVYGISDRNDTITAESDPLGNFILSCYEADWTITAKKEGYITALPRDTSVSFGQNVQLSNSIVLEQKPYTVSGVVKNTNGNAILGTNVELLLDGVTIGKVPSTPQDGSFSFSVESGTYTLKATKTGFTGYCSSLEVLNSKTVTITLQSGAALISGEIIGRSWNTNHNEIYAPITNASVLLIDTNVTPYDTLSTTSDAVYGNFEISTTGGKTYKLFSSANGYASGATYTDVIEAGKTHVVVDTLLAYARMTGIVRMSDTAGSVVDEVTINVIDTATEEIVATATSDALGTFEITGIPDGIHYRLQVGGDGLISDTLLLVDTAGAVLQTDLFLVGDGLPKTNTINTVIQSATVTMKSGTKALQWLLMHGSTRVTDASIKIKSPLLKTVNAANVIGGVGVGNYTMSIDADADSLIDLSYHKYTIPIDPDSLHTDTVALTFVHHQTDTIQLTNGLAQLVLYASSTLLDTSTAYLYFRDINAQSYDSVKVSALDETVNPRVYYFQLRPKVDGSYLVYYFKCRNGNDIYGYEQETFRTFIKPDDKVLTRIAITPSSKGDTLLFPADAEMKFSFSGYYGSKFLPATGLTDSNVTWSFITSGGCTIESRDIDAVIKTAAGGTGQAVAVFQAQFVAAGGYELAAELDSTVQVKFKVTKYKLDSISIRRVDSDDRSITTSPLDKAEFVAEGVDAGGTAVTISPTWEMIPDSVGTFTDGVFSAMDEFAGRVRILATIGDVTGEFNRQTEENINKSGLDVRYVVPTVMDTMNTHRGCRVVIPDNLIDAGEEALIQMKRPVISENKVKHISGSFDVVTDAFNFEEIKGITFNYAADDTTDSMVIIFDVPSEYHDDAKGSTGKYYVALWNADSLRWEPDSNSVVAVDGKSVSTTTTHFSRYALVRKATGTKAEFKVIPNPFSPFKRPTQDFSDLQQVPLGTCLLIRAESQYKSSLNLGVDIYNVLGDKVWSVVLQNVSSSREYKIWWDGKTTERTIALNSQNVSEDGYFEVTGKRMCRNGRYFAVLTIDDKEKKKQYKKQIILFK